ncbi:hypothetical protein [Nocardia sp. NPDC050710]|uniref:hypothetical protein n=1 Tax=Nocardia sp. NPDC050710 TaxID=3157220 RepID=UPI0034094E70
MPVQRQITYTDELLADGTAHRRYSDGRQEWRVRGPGVVTWRDDRGNAGTDEPLGPKLVKRVYRNGSVVYGREAGYGRTLWGDGLLTVNRSSFGGRLGVILAGVAGGALLGGLVMPPDALTAAEEEELRRQSAAQSTGSDSGGSEYGSWDDDSGDDGGDFG